MENPWETIGQETAEAEEEAPLPKKVTRKITSFRGNNEFLSNFYLSEIQIPIETDSGYEIQTFSTVEHAFQASKTKDKDIQKVVRDAKNAGEAKRIGRKVKLREDWEDIKLAVMEKCVLAKFIQNTALKMRLLFTRDAELIEGSKKDDFWGVTSTGGENNLGKILMKVRQHIIDEEGDFDECLAKFLRDYDLDFIANYGRQMRKDAWDKAMSISRQYGSIELIDKMMIAAEE